MSNSNPKGLDLFNRHGVGVHQNKVVVLMPPRAPLSRGEAMALGANLMVMAELLPAGGAENDGTIEEWIEASRNT